MLSLKEAREKVINVIGEGKTPAHTTLRSWANKGVISGVVEGDNKGAIYKNSLPAEIITAIELKKDFNLKEIANMRNLLFKEIEFDDLTAYEAAEEYVRLAWNVESENKLKNIKEKINNGISAKETKKIIEKFEKDQELRKKKGEYLKVYIISKQKLNEFKEVIREII